MIETETQYEVTKIWAQKFLFAIQAFDGSRADSTVNPLLLDAERSAMVSQLKDLQHEIKEYEQRVRNASESGH